MTWRRDFIDDKTAYQPALTFRLLQPTNEQTAKACIWIFI